MVETRPLPLKELRALRLVQVLNSSCQLYCSVRAWEFKNFCTFRH